MYLIIRTKKDEGGIPAILQLHYANWVVYTQHKMEPFSYINVLLPIILDIEFWIPLVIRFL